MKRKNKKRLAAVALLTTAVAAMFSGCRFRPEENLPEDIYGPPEVFYDPADNIAEPVYGPPDNYDPADNIPEDIYGPPEMMD